MAATADVAIVAGPFEAVGLELRTLFRQPRGLALSAHHPLAERAAVTVAEYLEQPIIDVPTHDQIWRSYWYATAHRHGRPPLVGATAHSMEGMLEAIRAGLGVALTIEPVVRELGPSPGIEFIPIPEFEPVDFFVGWRARDDRSEVKDFVGAALTAYRLTGERPTSDPATAAP